MFMLNPPNGIMIPDDYIYNIYIVEYIYIQDKIYIYIYIHTGYIYIYMIFFRG
jgi:hypothetical protein